MKTERIDEDHPTMKAIAKGHNALHDCLDATQQSVKRIETALGLDPEKPGAKPAAGLSTKWESWRRTFMSTLSALVTLAVAYRIVYAIAPQLGAIAGILNRMILTGHI